VQYVKGNMGVGQTIRGIVKIFTVAVSILFSVYAYC
jgi:P-type Ca2+ transporter type 2C